MRIGRGFVTFRVLFLFHILPSLSTLFLHNNKRPTPTKTKLLFQIECTNAIARVCVFLVYTESHTFVPHIHTNLFPLQIRLVSRSNVHCVCVRVSDKNTHGFPSQADTNTDTVFCVCVRQKTIST